jgi:hypothetical protein
MQGTVGDAVANEHDVGASLRKARSALWDACLSKK